MRIVVFSSLILAIICNNSTIVTMNYSNQNVSRHSNGLPNFTTQSPSISSIYTALSIAKYSTGKK